MPAKGDEVRQRVTNICDAIRDDCTALQDGDMDKCASLTKLVTPLLRAGPTYAICRMVTVTDGMVVSQVGKLSKEVPVGNAERFDAMLCASAALINAGCSKGEWSNHTLSITMEVYTSLQKVPYESAVDLAYQAGVYGRVIPLEH